MTADVSDSLVAQTVRRKLSIWRRSNEDHGGRADDFGRGEIETSMKAMSKSLDRFRNLRVKERSPGAMIPGSDSGPVGA